MNKRIAIPVEKGVLSSHFGHAKAFVFIDVVEGKIMDAKHFTPPPHTPGLIPRWLWDMGSTTVMANGMGSEAEKVLESKEMTVYKGLKPKSPYLLVEDLLNNSLEMGTYQCEHH